MRTISALLLVLLVSFPSGVHGRELVVLDFIGYGWETAAFPPSEVGDILSIPLIVDNLSASLGIDLGEEELPGYLSGLVSEGAEEIATGLWRVRYTGGTLSFHRDTAKDYDFGVFPPNATSPSTFTNGTLCLGGNLQNFTFYYHEPTGAGSMEASVQFTEGACLDALAGVNPGAVTFGGFLTRQSNGTLVEGYDLQLDGFLEAETNDHEGCDFACFAVSRASFELAQEDDDDDDNDGDDDNDNDNDGKHHKVLLGRTLGRCLDEEFSIEGAFAACQESAEVDPESVEITIRIGDYLQTLPAGSLEAEDDSTWEYKLKKACGELSRFVLEQEKDGSWEFKLKGEGIATMLLLPEGKLLHLQVSMGLMRGEDTVELEGKDDECVYESEHESPCSEEDQEDLAWGSQTLLRSEVALKANPNPFREGTTLFLNTPRSVSATVEVYDLRGRVVRVLHNGRVRPGEQQWLWDGADSQGVPVASGIYFYRVSTSEMSSVHKLIRMK